ncbi:MAG: DUF58 domain-containing protein [Pseudomonadota bacterium]
MKARAPAPEGLAFLPLRNGFWRRLFRLRAVEPLPYTVTPRRIYILPTRQGLAFSILLLGMLLGAMNYGLSMGFLFTFLLAGMLLSTLFSTWRLLLGLRLEGVEARPDFAGGQVVFIATLHLETGRDAGAYILECGGARGSFRPQGPGLAKADLGQAARQRGVQPLGPCRLLTEAPLGLFRAWTLFAPDAAALVWPRPADRALPLSGQAGQLDDKPGGSQRGTEDFDGLHAYSPGESPSRLAWKTLGRHDEPLVKQFIAPQGGNLWLDWYALPDMDTEARLAHLARWVVDADQRGLTYGLALPAGRIVPASGPTQRLRCLNALALHGMAEDQGGRHGAP